MTQPFVTGPVSLWAAFPSLPNQPKLIGWGEEAPEIEHRPQFEPVMCDLTGTRIPMDVADEGEDGIISVNLVRSNPATLAALQARPYGSLSARGTRLPGDLGTLYLTEKAAITLWVFFPYAALKPAFAGQPNGYRYFGAYLMGPDVLRKNGTRAQVVQCIFHALPALTYQGTVLTGGTLLYDNDMTAVANLPLN
jgi:hypothetical protein